MNTCNLDLYFDLTNYSNGSYNKIYSRLFRLNCQFKLLLFSEDTWRLAKSKFDILLEIAAEAEIELVEAKLKEGCWTLMDRKQEDEDLNFVFIKGYTLEDKYSPQ